MPSTLSRLLVAACIMALASCKGKDKGSPSHVSNDSPGATTKNPGNNASVDSSLAPVKEHIEKGLTQWMRSFNGFSIDSFRMTDVRAFDGIAIGDQPENMKQYYELYGASLFYSTDSSQFIDLYSANIGLEKKGKKIIAIGDADQAVLLCNEKTKEWIRILSFGPSAAIEEIVWTSPATFIMAGSFSNDEGKWTPILLLADANTRSMRWFESTLTRSESSSYGPSGMAKLKIDEWE